MNRKSKVIVIGSAIVDVLVTGVEAGVFERGSTPARGISMQTGGDALNEAIILAQLGRKVGLISGIGTDEGSEVVLKACRQAGVDVSGIWSDPDVATGVNIVLVDSQGERRFITNPEGSLRKIDPVKVLKALDDSDFSSVKVVSYASMFVHPPMLTALETVFARIKDRGALLCVDTTRPKNGEKVEDFQSALQYVDYLIPNYEEAAMLTGERDPEAIADALRNCGVKNVILKLGARGCLIKNEKICQIIPAVPGIHPVDTTGAGDNFAAGFIHALCEEKDILECARYANAVASLCVETLGATSGLRQPEEILRRMAMIK